MQVKSLVKVASYVYERGPFSIKKWFIKIKGSGARCGASPYETLLSDLPGLDRVKQQAKVTYTARQKEMRNISWCVLHIYGVSRTWPDERWR